jgi:hypothetical protein
MKLSVSRSLTNEIISVYLENPFNRPRKDEDIETAFFHGTKL